VSLKDWRDQLLSEISEDVGGYADVVSKVYATLNHYGLIDYDIEKEVLQEMYGTEDE